MAAFLNGYAAVFCVEDVTDHLQLLAVGAIQPRDVVRDLPGSFSFGHILRDIGKKLFRRPRALMRRAPGPLMASL